MKGILFKPDMIKAIVEGRKTATRRLQGFNEINKSPSEWFYQTQFTNRHNYLFAGNIGEEIAKPRYLPGETVYIKEAWYPYGEQILYRLDGTETLSPCETPSGGYPESCRHHPGCEGCMAEPTLIKWKSPMFLPEKFARYFIKIKDVRPERLQEITGEDSCKEGVILPFRVFGDGDSEYYEGIEKAYIEHYEILWDSINKKTPWASNPWVWRIEFERVEVSR